MAPEMLKYDIQLTTRSLPPEYSFTIDIDQMTQVVINLITNAAQAINMKAGTSKREKRIEIIVSGSTTETQIEVSDTGPGISPENREKVFIPFFSTHKNGSGIGLAIVRQIIRTHNGSISVKSSSSGTTFTVIL